jgi:hypothetical protein
VDLFHTLGTFFIPFRPGTLRQTIAYHMVLIITNRYENLAPGMKTGHLGMKQMPRVWKVCIKVWKKTMAVLSQTSCIPYVFNYTKMVWKCCTRYEKSSFGYETNAKGMKSLHDGMKQMTNVLKQTHIWRTPHCTTNGFFQDGICVVWVCFVPLSMAVHIVYCFQVYSYTTWTTQYLFYNQQRVENCIVCHWLHTTNGFVLYYWNFFCTRIRHIVLLTKSFFESFESSEKLGG